MEQHEMDKVLNELRERLEKLNDKMKGEVLAECDKHKKMYKEIIELAGELNEFFTK